ncbi:hypothetical protein ACFQH6_04040 [Halobacteriaceae archaeon GCM10025711]
MPAIDGQYMILLVSSDESNLATDGVAAGDGNRRRQSATTLGNDARE